LPNVGRDCSLEKDADVIAATNIPTLGGEASACGGGGLGRLLEREHVHLAETVA